MQRPDTAHYFAKTFCVTKRAYFITEIHVTKVTTGSREQMLQKGHLCYKKEERMLQKGHLCYKKEERMLQKGCFVTKRTYVVLFVTEYVTKRTVKCYEKEH